MTKSTIKIKHRYTGVVLFECDAPDDLDSGLYMRHALEAAVKCNANLRSADLRSADLSSADLHGAYLSDADLRSANLSGANLRDADLRDANLHGAYLSYANLSYANLSDAYLSYANLSDAYLRSTYLRDADLHGANLSDADLRSADLRRANLSGADLHGADLSYANLSGAKGADLAIAMTRILPDGDLVGWKKCRDGVIVKLRIPAEAKRSHAFGRKCRAEFADVLEVIGAEVGISLHDSKTEYRAGQRVTPDSFDENWMDECSNGVHFFITRLEAEEYL